MDNLKFATSVHILIYLASIHKSEQTLMTSAALADGLNANPALIRKLMGPLIEAGLVETVKGKSGGARLARSAKAITLKDIYVAISDRSIASSRENINHNCPVSSSMKKVFIGIAEGMDEALLSHLSQTTLEKILKTL